PYRGAAPMMGDLIGGQISMAFDGTSTALPQIQSGAIRAVGAGMAERMRVMPELPTLQEQGLKGFECYTWIAVLAPPRQEQGLKGLECYPWNATPAPAGTPQPIVDKLAGAIKVALDDPTVFKR